MMRLRKKQKKRQGGWQRYIFIFLVAMSICLSLSVTYGQEVDQIDVKEEVLDRMTDQTNLNDYLASLQEYLDQNQMDGMNLANLKDALIQTGTLDYKSIGMKILGLFSSDLVEALSGVIAIFIVIVVMSILSNLELEEKSDVTKLVHLVGYLTIVVIMFTTFTSIIASFKSVIGSLTTLMQIISPFLMAVIMATGKITSIGVIKPMLLFLASAIGFMIQYLVIPFICISVSFHIISNLSENLNLGRLGKLFSSFSIWTISVTLTIFLGILSLETTLTGSVDTLAIKATQTAVSNLVPVVGKFFSDSFETVVGATHVIANISGVLGILVIFIVAILPILKILSVMVLYTILAGMVEPICKDEKIVKLISSFASNYKILLGILIGVSILFIISIGIILNLASSVSS